MNNILLLGPQHDACLTSLAKYAERMHCPYVHISDFSQLRFSIWKNAEQTRFIAKWKDTLLPDDVGIFIRTPRSLVQPSPDHEIRFEIQEYFAALWSFCAMHPGVVMNRPGMMDWQYETHFKNWLFPGQYVPEWKASGAAFFREARTRLQSSGSREIHVEDALTYDRTICANRQDLQDLQQQFTETNGHFRAIEVESSQYLIQIVVGHSVTTVLNELDIPIDSETQQAWMEQWITPVHDSGVLFFAMVLTMMEGQLRLVRIEPQPPYEWYAHISDTINAQIIDLLQNGFVQRGQAG